MSTVLREALEKIRKAARDHCTMVESTGGYPGGGFYDTLTDIQRIAKAALSAQVPEDDAKLVERLRHMVDNHHAIKDCAAISEAADRIEAKAAK